MEMTQIIVMSLFRTRHSAEERLKEMMTQMMQETSKVKKMHQCIEDYAWRSIAAQSIESGDNTYVFEKEIET